MSKFSKREEKFLSSFLGAFNASFDDTFENWIPQNIQEEENWEIKHNNRSNSNVEFVSNEIPFSIICYPAVVVLFDQIFNQELTQWHWDFLESKGIDDLFNNDRLIEWFKSLSIEEQENVKSMYEQIDKIYNSFMKDNQDEECS